MTREEIMRLSGRELDAEVHRRIFGGRVAKAKEYIKIGDDGELLFWRHDYADPARKIRVPHYSSDIADAWDVLREVRLWCRYDRYRWACFWNKLLEMANENHENSVDFAEWILQEMGPEHICRAALMAVAGETGDNG